MKLATSILGLILGAASVAQATTITLGGGTAGLQWQSSTGVVLSPTNATIQVGSLVGGIFTQFAPDDLTAPTFATSAALLGRWSGNASVNGAPAVPFNGLQIWYQIDVNLGNGITGRGLFSQTGINFPNDANGVGDTLTVSSATLNVIGEASTAGSGLFADPDATGPLLARGVVGVVPEPSVALLGALGVFGLIRRRR